MDLLEGVLQKEIARQRKVPSEGNNEREREVSSRQRVSVRRIVEVVLFIVDVWKPKRRDNRCTLRKCPSKKRCPILGTTSIESTLHFLPRRTKQRVGDNCCTPIIERKKGQALKARVKVASEGSFGRSLRKRLLEENLEWLNWWDNVVASNACSRPLRKGLSEEDFGNDTCPPKLVTRVQPSLKHGPYKSPATVTPPLLELLEKRCYWGK